MPVLVVLGILFVAVPIVELAAILAVGQAIGLWPTVALLILDSLVGAALMRTQGRAVWRRFNAALVGGRVPTTEVVDGVLVIFGGACLLTPGFVTDLFGFALLFPPTRAVIRRVVARRVLSRMAAGATSMPFGGFGPGRGAGGRGPDGYDVEGTAHEVRSGEPRLRP